MLFCQSRKDNRVKDLNNYVKKNIVFNEFANELYINLNFRNMLTIFYKLNICLSLLIGLNSGSRVTNMETMESDILKYVNEDRQAHRLSPLQMNEFESSLATRHSHDMSVGKVKFGHDGFNSRAKAI